MAVSNAASLSVPKNAIVQFEALLRHIDRTGEIVDLSKKRGHGITLFEVTRPISEELKISHSELENVIFALENLRELTEEFGSPEEALDRIESATESTISGIMKENRAKIISSITYYSTDNPILISMKAQRLLYSYERIFRGCEIITDARPVFNINGNDIVEIIVSHTLVITHSSSGRTERSHLAMDASDVLAIREACDRAILKANTLKQALSTNQKWKVHVLRDDDAS